jgi:excisionase family DNA binding protein
VEIRVNGVCVNVPPEMEAAVQRAYKGLHQQMPAEMTTTQAAHYLDLSRPFVIRLIQRKELPCRMVGKHRRIPTAALLEYKENMFQQAKSATDKMTRMSQDLGLYDLEGPPPKRP